MKLHVATLVYLLLAASACLPAQTAATNNNSANRANNQAGTTSASATKKSQKKQEVQLAPFSRLAFSGGISLMGINMQAATNVDRYVNLRVTGNYFTYSMDNQSINDYTVNGKLNLAAMGASADFYPFPRHGLRFSPGVLVYNQNGANANVTVAGGTKLSLNDVDYYSSKTHPIQGNAALALNKRNPTFTMTTGWGNLISRRGGHWSFPFELGVALIDQPQVNLNLTGGQACDASGAYCQDVTSYTALQTNLQTQITKYQNDLSMLRYYPIISFGVGYNFRIR